MNRQSHFMLKLSQSEAANRTVTLKLEGRVVGPWVGELHRVCESILSEDRKLELELTEVSFVDAAGVVTLTSLRSRGVTVTNCSPFVEEQLKSAGGNPS